ncbi:MAG TPA: HAMP domain-containing sensor histidine kinase [Actinotalea sp.]
MSALAVALAVVTAVFSVLLSRALEHDAAAVLQTRLEAATAAVTVSDGEVVVADSAGDETLDATTWVLGGRGVVVLAPTASSAPTAAIVRLAGVRVPTARDVGTQTRVLASPLPGEDPTTATVVVSVPLAPYETTERAGLVAALALDAVTLGLLAVLARWLVGSALRPVDQMTRRAHDWAEHDVDRRFPESDAHDDEIGRLGATLNDLLARLGASLRHERRLTDEIAHELRTPLARARMEAELSAGRDDPEELRAALRAIIGDVDELSGTVNTLMDAARLGVLDARECDVGAEIRDLTTAADRRGIVHVDLPAEPAFAALDGALVRRILSPQLDNALRHATSGVDVVCRHTGAWIDVSVIDDGPGVAGDDLDRVFLPGERGEASDGLGLGLALARRLARAAGGDVSADPGPGGRFRTRLPAQPVRS